MIVSLNIILTRILNVIVNYPIFPNKAKSNEKAHMA